MQAGQTTAEADGRPVGGVTCSSAKMLFAGFASYYYYFVTEVVELYSQKLLEFCKQKYRDCMYHCLKLLADLVLFVLHSCG